MEFVPSWAIGAVVIIVAVAIAQAIGRIVRGPSRSLATSDAGVEELRQHLETMQNRVAELEERVDFTERLLARQREETKLR